MYAHRTTPSIEHIYMRADIEKALTRLIYLKYINRGIIYLNKEIKTFIINLEISL